MTEMTRIWDGRAVLGEGPVWDATEKALFWVDIDDRKIYRHDSSGEAVKVWSVPGKIGCMALDGDGNFIVGLQQGLHRVDRATGNCELLIDPEPDIPANRFNDGKVDPQGRLWAGTLPANQIWEPPVGNLYVFLDSDHCVRRLTGMRCSNGLGWSKDGQTMYVTDSMIGTIWAFDFDPETATLEAQRVFVQWSMDEGVPDGLAVDELGYVWTAVWDGGELRRYSPDGRLDATLQTPFRRPTSCAFGGPELDVLYVTSASTGLAALNEHDGGVYAIEPGVRGLPVPRCAMSAAR
jgi:sugar lactone lactonase YvrE